MRKSFICIVLLGPSALLVYFLYASTPNVSVLTGLRLFSPNASRVNIAAADNTCTIARYDFGSSELETFLTACKDQLLVPNIVNYVWLSKHEFHFHNLISFMSAYRYQKPCIILIHSDVMPYGEWWDYTVSRMCNKLIHVFREQPTSIFGNEVVRIEHRADICKIEALKEYGGIGMDVDQVILKSLDPLRKFEYTGCEEEGQSIGLGLVLSKKGSPFSQLHHLSYNTFSKSQWGTHSVEMPFKLSQIFPTLIHVEKDQFYTPSWRNYTLIHEGNFDWANNYSIHLYYRFYKKDHNPEDIKTLNTTIGSVYRHVFYGHRQLITPNDTALLSPLPKVT